MPTLKFRHFDPKPWAYPLEKSRFLDGRQIIFKKLPIESVCLKTSPETLLRPPKGPGTKTQPTKDEVG